MACPHCESTATSRRVCRTALGYRRFNCRSCRRRFNERNGTPFSGFCQISDDRSRHDRDSGLLSPALRFEARRSLAPPGAWIWVVV